MTASDTAILARGRTDGEGLLIAADEPLAGLQLRCGGELPGVIAVHELRQIVGRALATGLRRAGTVRAYDGEEQITAWVQIEPEKGEGAGCTIALANWQASAPLNEDSHAVNRRDLIDSALAELSARLDPDQTLLSVQSDAPDLRDALAAMQSGIGRPWTDFVELPGNQHRQPLHWRLLDRTDCKVPGSPRSWTARLVPLGAPLPGSDGFELYLVADRAWVERKGPRRDRRALDEAAIGRDLTPVLRQPISRIIANAETIRARLAGPLSDEYSNYAADIASAAQHLLSLVDDLADLEVVEAKGFETAPDRIDLADVARRSAGILGVRAQERRIVLRVPGAGKSRLAIGEFRRVLQILLNLVGNAIRYAPEGSHVDIAIGRRRDAAFIAVRDTGPGLDDEQQRIVFEKFERLGRSGDGGSGLGLYISRRLAEAMGGTLTVQSEKGEGAIFTLTLPLAEPDA